MKFFLITVFLICSVACDKRTVPKKNRANGLQPYTDLSQKVQECVSKMKSFKAVQEEHKYCEQSDCVERIQDLGAHIHSHKKVHNFADFKDYMKIYRGFATDYVTAWKLFDVKCDKSKKVAFFDTDIGLRSLMSLSEFTKLSKIEISKNAQRTSKETKLKMTKLYVEIRKVLENKGHSPKQIEKIMDSPELMLKELPENLNIRLRELFD